MNEELRKEISKEEIRNTLHTFQKGKILGPDGFTLEFYLGFYDMLKKDILEMVKESQISGKVLGMINSTFLTLIPKKQKAQSFDDFIPISCCNMIYKIIAKVIAFRIKSILSEIISEEQLGFLFNRKIHDAVSLAREAIHTIKKEKQRVFALKLDLSKAYDKVGWIFVRLVLIKIGIYLEVVEWIMDCLQSTSFVILINGSPTNFFRPSRGLRQGCPLSPFIFLLVVEALSRIIHNVKESRVIKGIKVSKSKEVTHTLLWIMYWSLGKDPLEILRPLFLL